MHSWSDDSINLYVVLLCFQKQLRGHRDVMMSNMIENLETTIKENPSGTVNFRELFKDELFRLALKEVSLIKPMFKINRDITVACNILM